MLGAARARRAGVDNVELEEGDLEALPLPTARCDAALLLLALTHVAEPAARSPSCARILKPGGRAVIVDLLRHDREDFRREMGQLRPGFEPDELARLLAAAGFAGVRCRPLPPEPEAKGPALLLATGTRNANVHAPFPPTRGKKGRAPMTTVVDRQAKPPASTSGSPTSRSPSGAARRSASPSRRCPA